MDDRELVAELQKKAAECRRKADAYEKAAQELAGALGGPTNGRRPATPREPATQNPAPGRVRQIGEFLERNGPATRGEVMRGAGVPEGSVRAVLNRHYFERDEANDRWVRLLPQFQE